jgi:hypothetical protein
MGMHSSLIKVLVCSRYNSYRFFIRSNITEIDWNTNTFRKKFVLASCLVIYLENKNKQLIGQAWIPIFLADWREIGNA